MGPSGKNNVRLIPFPSSSLYSVYYFSAMEDVAVCTVLDWCIYPHDFSIKLAETFVAGVFGAP